MQLITESGVNIGTAAKKLSVAVLLSAYNGEKYLCEQIDSILAQERTLSTSDKNDFNLQLYIRDDGSTDKTKEILQQYSTKDNVHIFYGENEGITASYFELISLAGEHDYYSLSDQDDVWLSEKLRCAIEALEREKKKHLDGFPLLYGCQSYLVNEKLKKTGQLTQKQLRPLTIYNTAIQNILLGHNQVFNRALAIELYSKDLDYSQIYAHDMWITQVASIKGKIIFENKAHTLYRQHSANELGYGSGAGTLKWIIARIERVKKGESRLIGQQTRYFFKLYDGNTSQKDQDALKMVFDEDNRINTRASVVLRGKLYRQNKVETLMFMILYTIGKYN